MNRLANTKNPYQSDRKKVLCVCSAGLLRSPTISWVLSNPPYNCNTRACGTSKEYALIVFDSILAYWADEIICADKSSLDDVIKLLSKFKYKRSVYCLELPDNYHAYNPRLIQLIRKQLKKIKFK